MKYAEYILKHYIPEWALMYFNYKAVKAYLSTSGALKDFLLFAKKTKTTHEYKEIKKNVMEMTYMIAKIEADYKELYKRIHQELEKVKTFINIKYNDLVGKTYKIQLQLLSMNRIQRQLIRNQQRYTLRSRSQVVDELSEQLTLKSLKIKESEFNLKCKLLKELCFKLYNEGVNFDRYLKVNQEAIRKLMKKQAKKFVKITQDVSQLEECKKKIIDLDIYSKQNKVKQLLFQVEKYLLKHFYQAKPYICKEQLRKYQFQNDKKNRAWFQFGLFTGFSLMLLSFIFFLASQNQLDVLNNPTIFESFPIYRGALLFILYFWSLALMVFLWNKSKINYKLFFAFNHHFSTLNEILKRVMTLTTIFLLVTIAYICDISKLGRVFSSFKGEDYFPLIIWISLFFTVLFPSKTFINGKGRLWLYRNLIQSFQMKQVELRHFFIISQFTSLVIPFSDLTYTICEYSKGIQNNDTSDDNQYDECFYLSRYFTLALVLLPYCIINIQVLFLSMKYSKINDYMIEFIRNICSITLIIFATMSQQDEQFFIYWLIMTIIIIILNMVSSFTQWDYLKQRDDSKTKFSYKYKLILVYFPFAIIQPLSISTSIFGVFDKKEQHSLGILYIGMAELIRRMIINYYFVDADHFKNKQTYQTVGAYEFPFDECCQTIRKTQLMQYNSDESQSDNDDEQEIEQIQQTEKEIEVILQEQEQQDNRLNFGLFIQGGSTYDQLNQMKNQSLPNQLQGQNSNKNKLKISELIQKDSEKALGESFLNYDINNFKPDEVQELINFQQISQIDQDRLHFNNKHYKKEIKQLYETYGIKLKK